MLRKNLIFALTILILTFPNAFSQSELDYQIVEVSLRGDVKLDFQTLQSRVDYFTADLGLFPRDSYREDVLELKLNHEPSASVVMKNNIEYTWNDDTERMSFGYDSKVKVWNRIFQITSDIPLSRLELMKEHVKYVRETEFVDVNNEIREKAFEITDGGTTLYETVFKLAEWTRTNIKYDLNTLTEEATQKSSWVLENKFGVCDEITNLFVSFLRSMNIPVRYVVGIAYSDAVPEGWAPHAWAEVYFQGYGWMPWDVTFGQYGWVDTGHVKLSESLDARDPSVEYTWRAVKVGLEEKNIELNTSIIKKGEKIFPLVEINADALLNEIKGGSYVPLEVSIKNLQSYYLSTLVFVKTAPGVIGDNTKAVLLKPHEEKEIKWILNVPELNGDFTYKSDIEVAESFGSDGRDELLIGDKFKFYSKEDVENLSSRSESDVSNDEEFETEISFVSVKNGNENTVNDEIKSENIFEKILMFLDNLF